MVLHKYPLNAGTLAAIAKQFNPVLALHAIILAEAARRVYRAKGSAGPTVSYGAIVCPGLNRLFSTAAGPI